MKNITSTSEVPEVIKNITSIDSAPNASSLTSEPTLGEEIVSSRNCQKLKISSVLVSFSSILQNTTLNSYESSIQNTEQESDQKNVLDVLKSSNANISASQKNQFVSNWEVRNANWILKILSLTRPHHKYRIRYQLQILQRNQILI